MSSALNIFQSLFPSAVAAEAMKFRAAFENTISPDGVHYITQIPREDLLPEGLASLRQILHYFEGDPATQDTSLSGHHSQVATSATPQGGLREASNDYQGPRADYIPRLDSDDGNDPIVSTTRRREHPSITIDPSDDKGTLNILPQKRGRPGRPPKAGEDGPAAHRSKLTEPYGALLAVDDFTLHETLQGHLNDNPTHDPRAFLGDSLPRIPKGIPSPENFPDFCRAVGRMEKTDTMTSVRRLFVLHVLGEIAAVFGSMPRRRERTITAAHSEKTYEEISPTIKAALAVVFLCKKEVFGTGCLFFLAKQLTDKSDHFLRDRVTFSGKFYERAVKHLTDKGLLPGMQTSPTTQLGDAITAHLRDFYHVGEIGTEGMDPDEDGKAGLVDGERMQE